MNSRQRSMKWISRCAAFRFPKERMWSASSSGRVPYSGERISRWLEFSEQRYWHSGVERVGALLRSITIEVKSPPRGIVFDMDGVLLNSSPIHAAAYLEALGGLSIPDFRYSRVAGMRSSDGMRAILKQNNIQLPDEQIAALAEAKSRIALTRIAAENPIVPGAMAVLRTLAGRVRLAL